MKTIKIIALVLFLVLTAEVGAQEYSQELKGGSDQTIRFENVIANLTIEGTSGNKLTINAAGMKPPPEKAEGLKALKRTGIDNTGLALNIHVSGDVVFISGGSSEENLSYTVELPENVNLSIVNNNFFQPNMQPDMLKINSMKGEIEIGSYYGSVYLADVTGPVVANINHGELNVTFSELNQESPMSLICSENDIDISIPSGSNATFNLAAGNGEIYTDLELEKVVEEKEEIEISNYKVYSRNLDKWVRPDINLKNQYRFSYSFKDGQMDSLLYFKPHIYYAPGNIIYSNFFGGYDYKGNLNGGGVEITIRTQNGNLYLRKARK